MQLQYLGTSASEGWPSLFCNCDQCETARLLGRRNIRTRSQAVIYADGVGSGSIEDILLIDLPPDTYMHVLQHGLRLDRIGHMLVTHSHPDHFTPNELTFRSGAHVNPAPNFPLNLYGNEHTEDRFNRTFLPMKTHLAQSKWPDIEFHVVENFKPFQAGSYTVVPMPASHGWEERCLIYLIERENKRILYAHDTGIFPEETFEFIAGKPLDLISLDCTYGSHILDTNHMGLPDTVNVKRRLETLGCLKSNTRIVLNHFSHYNGTCYDAMVELAAPYTMEVSYDGGVWDV